MLEHLVACGAPVPSTALAAAAGSRFDVAARGFADCALAQQVVPGEGACFYYLGLSPLPWRGLQQDRSGKVPLDGPHEPAIRCGTYPTLFLHLEPIEQSNGPSHSPQSELAGLPTLQWLPTRCTGFRWARLGVPQRSRTDAKARQPPAWTGRCGENTASHGHRDRTRRRPASSQRMPACLMQLFSVVCGVEPTRCHPPTPP